MKKLYPLTVLFLAVHFTFANPLINSVPGNGNWSNVSTWSLGRLPMDGDSVVIGAGKTVTITDIENLSTQFLYVKIYGVLTFSSGKLWINNGSTVIILSGGTLKGTGSSSETLRIGGVDKYVGTDGTLSGPLFANQTTSASPVGFSSGFLLPVKFISFDIVRQNNDVLVQWETAEEMNNSYYELQRSDNGSDWNTISHVTATAAPTNTHSYSYVDKNVPHKLFYYRIREVDADGKYAITQVRALKNEMGNTEITVSAGPSNLIYLHFSEQVKGSVVVRLVSSNGQTISREKFNEPAGQVTVGAQNAIKGIYVVTVADGQNLKFSKEILL